MASTQHTAASNTTGTRNVTASGLQQSTSQGGVHRLPLHLNPVSTARRKLVDEIMRTFVIGNTFARSLLTKTEAQGLCSLLAQQQPGSDIEKPVKLLWVGVGDIRNPLTTLTAFPPSPRVNLQFHLNDVSSATIARAVVLLIVGSQRADVAGE